MAEELLVGQRHPSIQGRANYRLWWEMTFSTAPPSHPSEARYLRDYVLNMDKADSSTTVPAPDKPTTVKDCLAPPPTHAIVTSVCQTQCMGEAHSLMRAGTSAVTSQPHPAWDLRHSTRIATWNPRNRSSGHSRPRTGQTEHRRCRPDRNEVTAATRQVRQVRR